MTFFEPDSRDKALFPWDPFKGVVVPRPIGWITSLSPEGVINLAPFSFFNAFGDTPPIVGFAPQGRKPWPVLARCCSGIGPARSLSSAKFSAR